LRIVRKLDRFYANDLRPTVPKTAHRLDLVGECVE
jgi:hypothetical protein